mmetsp:Transcript_10526/g.15706  ORF Transcript_10526/g.15706 Transcript_10526/m.15706 type:complete len:596 (+) Transcript_10526:107-1894(+)
MAISFLDMLEELDNTVDEKKRRRTLSTEHSTSQSQLTESVLSRKLLSSEKYFRPHRTSQSEVGHYEDEREIRMKRQDHRRRAMVAVLSHANSISSSCLDNVICNELDEETTLPTFHDDEPLTPRAFERNQERNKKGSFKSTNIWKPKRRGRRPCLRRRSNSAPELFGQDTDNPIVLRVVKDIIIYRGEARVVEAKDTKRKDILAKDSFLLFQPPPGRNRISKLLNMDRFPVERAIIPANRTYPTFVVPKTAVEVELLPMKGTDAVHVLNYGHARMLLRLHLEREMSAEGLDFWEATRGFSKLHVRELVYKTARRIIKRFVKDRCPHPVNLSADIRLKMLSDFKQKKISPTMFESARNEVQTLIKRDPFRRFRKSHYFRVLTEGKDMPSTRTRGSSDYSRRTSLGTSNYTGIKKKYSLTIKKRKKRRKSFFNSLKSPLKALGSIFKKKGKKGKKGNMKIKNKLKRSKSVQNTPIFRSKGALDSREGDKKEKRDAIARERARSACRSSSRSILREEDESAIGSEKHLQRIGILDISHDTGRSILVRDGGLSPSGSPHSPCSPDSTFKTPKARSRARSRNYALTPPPIPAILYEEKGL